jgi:hypothetical protein
MSWKSQRTLKACPNVKCSRLHLSCASQEFSLQDALTISEMGISKIEGTRRPSKFTDRTEFLG